MSYKWDTNWVIHPWNAFSIFIFLIILLFLDILEIFICFIVVKLQSFFKKL